jgi:hypothetical protein
MENHMNKAIYKYLLLLVLLAASLGAFPSAAAQAHAEARCFRETEFCISGRIRDFWEQNGGLPVFGFPITPQVRTRIEGMVVPIQWFERARLEVHADEPRPYDVLLGRLGADVLHTQGRDRINAPAARQGGDCVYFPETQHNVCGAFLKLWHAYGLEFDGRAGRSAAENLALLGLPISEPILDTSADGQMYLMQWFERARFELHPENPPPYNVLLGRLGGELPIAQPRPTLQRASPPMQGDTVFELQGLLSDLGYAVGPIDGIYGPQTEAGVRNFQYANWLDVDGVAGPATWAALRAPGPQRAGD